MADSRLALLGGTPLRTQPFTKWPVTGKEEVLALCRVLESEKWGSGMYFGNDAGSEVRRFEKRFAEYQQCRYGVAVANGTAALEIILRALKVAPGDEVIVPDFTFIATASAVLQMGAIPVFVDVLPNTFNIDPEAVEAAITPKTRAVIGVHWGGQPCDIDRLGAICAQHGVAFVEDACQAHSAEWKGQRVGGLGLAGAFSFQGTKNLPAGEGGLVSSNHEQLFEMCYSLHTIGRKRGSGNYEHFYAGWNYRLTEFQGALLNVQFDRLPGLDGIRQRNVQHLLGSIAEVPGLSAQKVDPRVTRCSWYVVIVEVDPAAFGVSRNVLVAALQAEGIPAAAPYHYALHLNPVFQERAFPWVPGADQLDYSRAECPVADRLCRNTIFFPQYVLLGSEDDASSVGQAVKKIAENVEELRALPAAR